MCRYTVYFKFVKIVYNCYRIQAPHFVIVLNMDFCIKTETSLVFVYMHFLKKFQQLDSEEVNNVSTLLNILQNHGRNINILGEVGFPAMFEYGLIQKISI